MASRFKKLRDTFTGHSKTSVGKFYKYGFPFNGGYLLRKAWHSVKKRLLPARSNSAVSIGGSDIYGPTGSIVGRF